MWPGYGDHMGWMGLWWLGGLVVLLLLIWAVARAAAGPSSAARGEESPETILKRQYPRGEMDRDAYERRLGDLRK